MNKILMGIDVGTSACKVAVFDQDGRVIAQTSGEYNVYYPAPGYAEQNPDEWWKVICKAIKETITKESINPA